MSTPAGQSSGRDAGEAEVARAEVGKISQPPACADPVLERLKQLADGPGVSRSPAALLAMVDGLEAHQDHGCEVGGLLLAVRLLHAGAVCRGAGETDRALELLGTGRDLLRACLLPSVNGGSL